MLDFYVGQKVVCMDVSLSGDRRFDQTLDGLKKGSVYTIRWIGKNPDWYCEAYPDRATNIVVMLVEIRRPACGRRGGEIGYRATRFRPLIETDISVFTAMLAPTPVKQRETQDA